MVHSIRIHDQHWQTASPARRSDWRASIVDLRDTDSDPAREALVVRADVDVVVLTLGEPPAQRDFPISVAALTPLVTEYLQVIHRMQTEEVAESSAKMQALDMAKRVVHDRGARVVALAVPELNASHETYRRLFTLVVSVVVDVTVLPGVRAHRKHVTY